MQRDALGLGQQRLQAADAADAEGLVRAILPPWVVEGHLEAACLGAQGDGAADAPEADEAEHRAAHTADIRHRSRDGVCASDRLACRQLLGARQHATVQTEDERHRGVGHLFGAVIGDVAHGHARRRGRVRVDVVIPDSHPYDVATPLQPAEQHLIEPESVPDRDHVSHLQV